MTIAEQAPQAGADTRLHGWTSVLVHVEDAAVTAPRLKAAIALAKRCDARLIGVGAQCVDPTGRSSGQMAGEAWPDLHAQCREQLAQAADAFGKAVGPLPAEFRSIEAGPVPAMARIARAASVIVAGGAPRQREDACRTAAPEDLAIASGRPVLVAPPAERPLVGESVVLGWKESREARRAMLDALPLLCAAKNVVVVEVCTFDERGEAEFRTGDVATALARYGVRARGKAVCGDDADDEQVALKLIAEADGCGADVIVVGCYAHLRIDQSIFGGVLRNLLNTTDRYLLISH